VSHANAELIKRFYAAFHERDAKAMAACYAKAARFSDPVFPDLHGADIGRMWTMLTKAAKDLEVTAHGIEADATSGSCRWEARYTFGRTGRKVHNVIQARFEFKGGRIVRHEDSFSFWRWSRQALGPVGLLLGWTPRVRSRVRKDAARRLAAFQA
jgi:ketosteroid isomerase-like protein